MIPVVIDTTIAAIHATLTTLGTGSAGLGNTLWTGSFGA